MKSKYKYKSPRKSEYWVERGHSIEEAEFLKLTRTPGKFEYFKHFKKMSDEEARHNAAEYDKLKAVTLENMIRRHGEIEGPLRFESYKRKQAESNSYEYKKKKHGWTKKKFDEFNRSRSVTKANLIRRHGQKEGIAKFEKYRARQSYAGCKLEYFVEKYGVDEGTKKYTDLNIIKSHTFESYLIRNNGDVELANEQYNKYLANTLTPYSNLANEFFRSLYQLIKHKQFKEVYFQELNQEWVLRKKNDRAIFLDFFVRDVGKVIEFFGDYWHANPLVYKNQTHINHKGNKKRNIQEIWDTDRKRIDTIRRVPYIKDVKIVWESDYKERPMETLNICKEFILND